jgi:hypothetical protein
VFELVERATAHPGDLKESVLPQLRQLFAEGEFETLLPMAEALLASNPDGEVSSLVEVARTKLAELYLSRLGRLSSVPLLNVPPNEWVTLDLDHRACFLLVHIDNVSTVDMILDVSGMARHEALRVLCSLLARGIIAI